MKYIEQIKIQVIIILIMQVIALGLIAFLGWFDLVIALSIYFVINLILFVWIVYMIEKVKVTQDLDISRVLGHEAKEALSLGQIGIVIIDDNLEVTWQSSFLNERKLLLIGHKVTTLFEEVRLLFDNQLDSVTGERDGYIYEVTRKKSGSIIYIRDISDYALIKNKYEQDSAVVGIVYMDNYNEISSYEDEAQMTAINMGLRQPIVEWATKYKMMIRRLRSDRFIVILNERIFQELLEDKFSILNETRKVAHELDVSISLSMAFARGSDDFNELDKMANDLLELAQSRGGDQVAVKRYGYDVKYYGGNSEAVSKRSRVRVRVMATAIKEAILESDRVFISGHKEMDFDCMGANLALSRVAQNLGKQTYIVSESGGLEQYLSNAMEFYKDNLNNRHNFITDEEAVRLKGKNDLLLVADYHNPLHSNAPLKLEQTQRVVVIDHHRRTENYIQRPLLVYIESGASSTCELLTECFEYFSTNIGIDEVEATFMYLGILVDTNRFKMRTGFRTFEAAAMLKKMGVNPIDAEDLLKENFNDFEAKITIFKYGELYRNSFMIACVENETCISRTLMSMSADALLAIKDVEASFVIAKTNTNSTSISARSKGVINVQRIMEELHGGGHFSAAATQSEEYSPIEFKNLLMNQIDLYISEEEEKDESNIIK